MDRRGFLKFAAGAAGALAAAMPLLASYPTTALGLKEFMESGMEVGAPTNYCLSVTGEPYVVLEYGVIKPKGMPRPQWCARTEEAIRAFITEFRKYKAGVGRGARLYWRSPPEIGDRDGRMSVRARFLISKNSGSYKCLTS